MFARYALAVLVVLAGSALALPGCGSGGDSANTCTQISDCPTWRCTCRNGQFGTTANCSNAECTPGKDQCTSVCFDRGGLKSFEQVPDLTKSAECAAFCEKVDALGCGTCDKNYWCRLGNGECADAKRALLTCEVDTGKWQCNPSGGFTVESACPKATCATDAGSDAAPDGATSDATAE